MGCVFRVKSKSALVLGLIFLFSSTAFATQKRLSSFSCKVFLAGTLFSGFFGIATAQEGNEQKVNAAQSRSEVSEQSQSLKPIVGNNEWQKLKRRYANKPASEAFQNLVFDLFENSENSLVHEELEYGFFYDDQKLTPVSKDIWNTLKKLWDEIDPQTKSDIENQSRSFYYNVVLENLEFTPDHSRFNEIYRYVFTPSGIKSFETLLSRAVESGDLSKASVYLSLLPIEKRKAMVEALKKFQVKPEALRINQNHGYRTTVELAFALDQASKDVYSGFGILNNLILLDAVQVGNYQYTLWNQKNGEDYIYLFLKLDLRDLSIQQKFSFLARKWFHAQFFKPTKDGSLSFAFEDYLFTVDRLTREIQVQPLSEGPELEYWQIPFLNDDCPTANSDLMLRIPDELILKALDGQFSANSEFSQIEKRLLVSYFSRITDQKIRWFAEHMKIREPEGEKDFNVALAKRVFDLNLNYDNYYPILTFLIDSSPKNIPSYKSRPRFWNSGIIETLNREKKIPELLSGFQGINRNTENHHKMLSDFLNYNEPLQNLTDFQKTAQAWNQAIYKIYKERKFNLSPRDVDLLLENLNRAGFDSEWSMSQLKPWISEDFLMNVLGDERYDLETLTLFKRKLKSTKYNNLVFNSFRRNLKDLSTDQMLTYCRAIKYASSGKSIYFDMMMSDFLEKHGASLSVADVGKLGEIYFSRPIVREFGTQFFIKNKNSFSLEELSLIRPATPLNLFDQEIKKRYEQLNNPSAEDVATLVGLKAGFYFAASDQVRTDLIRDFFGKKNKITMAEMLLLAPLAEHYTITDLVEKNLLSDIETLTFEELTKLAYQLSPLKLNAEILRRFEKNKANLSVEEMTKYINYICIDDVLDDSSNPLHPNKLILRILTQYLNLKGTSMSLEEMIILSRVWFFAFKNKVAVMWLHKNIETLTLEEFGKAKQWISELGYHSPWDFTSRVANQIADKLWTEMWDKKNE